MATSHAYLKSAAAEPTAALLWRGRPSFWSYLSSWFWGVLLLPFGLGWLILLRAYLDRRSRAYAISAAKAGSEAGLFVTSTREVRIGDIRSIAVLRRGLGGFFGLGTLRLSTAAHDSADVSFHGIAEADAVADVVRAIQDGRAPSLLPPSSRAGSPFFGLVVFAALALVPLLSARYCAAAYLGALRPRAVAAVAAPPAPAVHVPTVIQPPAAPSAAPTPTFAQAVAASQRRAVALYPDLGRAGSPLNLHFLARYDDCRRRGDIRLSRPDWPEQLAADCASTPARIANR